MHVGVIKFSRRLNIEKYYRQLFTLGERRRAHSSDTRAKGNGRASVVAVGTPTHSTCELIAAHSQALPRFDHRAPRSRSEPFGKSPEIGPIPPPLHRQLAKQKHSQCLSKSNRSALTCCKISEVQMAADSLSLSRVKRVVRFCIHVPKHDHTA